jgi:hypothetical protein
MAAPFAILIFRAGGHCHPMYASDQGFQRKAAVLRQYHDEVGVGTLR